MKTPFVLVSLALLVFISQQQLSEANCGNGVSNSDEAKCRKDEAPGLIQKNHNRGSSSDSDSDSGNGDSGSDSGSDDDGDGNSDSDSGNSGDLEDDWDSLPDEATAASGTPATRPSGATKKYRQNLYHCTLTDAIRNISVVLDEEQNGRLKECMRKIEHFLSHSFGLSDAKRAAKAAHKLKQCLKKHGDIAKLIQFEKITTWGSIFDVTYVSVDLSADFIDVTITLDSNNDCELFEALRNASQGDIQMESDVLVLIEELKVILLDVTLSMGQKKAKMHDKFKMFFELHVEYEEILLEAEMEGCGCSVGSFVDVAHGHKQSLTLEVVLSGSSDSDCALCAALTEAAANTSYTISIRSQIKQFHDKLISFFATTTDVEVRLAYVSAQYWQMIIMEPWIVRVMSLVSIKDKTCGCDEPWGIFYDIIWVSQFCKNSGMCGCLSCGMNPATTVKPSTLAPTTVASTIPPAVCPNRAQLIVVTTQNTTILTDVLTVNYNSWNSSVRAGFNTCFNQVRTAIWNNAAFPTPSSKITEIVTRFKAYNANNLNAQKVLMDIFIAKWNGKIQQFCDCGSG